MSRRRAEPRQPVHPGLAAEQAALVRALTGVGPPPAGFDATGLDATARALSRKRARGVIRALPALGHALGARFAPLFAGFAAREPPPVSGGPLVDAHAFLRWLARAGLLDDDLRLELLRVRLHQGWPLVVGWLRDRRHLAVGLALPGAQPRWLTLPVMPRRLNGSAQSPPASGRRA